MLLKRAKVELRRFLLRDGLLRIEAIIVLRRLLGHRYQNALGNIQLNDLGEAAGTFFGGELDLELRHPRL
jgi:hypothetical protein